MVCRYRQKPELSCATQLDTVSNCGVCSDFTYGHTARNKTHYLQCRGGRTSTLIFADTSVASASWSSRRRAGPSLAGAQSCPQPLQGASDPTTDTGPPTWHSGQHPKFCLHWKHQDQRLSCCLSWFGIQELDLNPGRSTLESHLSHTHSSTWQDSTLVRTTAAF